MKELLIVFWITRLDANTRITRGGISKKSSHFSYFMQLRKHKVWRLTHCTVSEIGIYIHWILHNESATISIEIFTNLLLSKRCCISNVSNYSMQNILWLGWLVSHVLTKKGFFLFLIIAAMQLSPIMQLETYMSV